MKSCAGWLFLLSTLMFCQTSQSDSRKAIALPNPRLFRCAATRLWQDEKPQPGETYPARMFVDHFDKDGCPQGILALYDKSISEDQIRAAINQRYGKWATVTGVVGVWRVEDERFAIQLTTIKDKKKCVGGEEMRQLFTCPFMENHPLALDRSACGPCSTSVEYPYAKAYSLE